jgi:hypothetical protein
MQLKEYLKLMEFPQEWGDWEMVPESFASLQASQCELGDENAPEHDRHGMFQWWLRQEPDATKLVLLARLSWLDPDEPMAASVRKAISKQTNFSSEVAQAIGTPYHRA